MTIKIEHPPSIGKHQIRQKEPKGLLLPTLAVCVLKVKYLVQPVTPQRNEDQLYSEEEGHN
jgi:hypothetical protein